MDSRWTKRAMTALILLFFTVFAGLVAANFDAVLGKLGLSGAEAVQEDEEAPKEEKPEGQIGSNLSGFLGDETFFDPEVKFKSIESYEGRNVSLIMSSVAKDLRVMVVDSVGRLVTGADFTIELQGIGEYTDSDEDGVIYVDGLRSGEYSVSLQEKDGFRVPNTITTIQVRQDIEYRMIDNIEYLMLTEDDVDAAKEDKAVNSAAQDADGTEESRMLFGQGDAKLGIDVSKWNQEIDWEAVKRAGVEFAIIRCGYRGASTGALVIDPRYEENIEGAIQAGIPVGVYFFTQARDEVEAVEEASMTLRLIEEYDVDYPVFLDSESTGGKGRADELDNETRTKAHRAFLQTIRAAGYETGVYASKNWLKDRLDMTALSDYRIWLAEYAKAPTYDEHYYHMWQYTSKGTVEGIVTDVDLNLCYMNIDTSVNHAKGAAGYSGVVSGNAGNVPR